MAEANIGTPNPATQGRYTAWLATRHNLVSCSPLLPGPLMHIPLMRACAVRNNYTLIGIHTFVSIPCHRVGQFDTIREMSEGFGPEYCPDTQCGPWERDISMVSAGGSVRLRHKQPPMMRL